MKHYRQHGRITRKLVPSGGLGVGSDKLSAGQVGWALKAGQRRNFRFKLQSELIATLLNQLGGASTPAKVQEAVDAAQLRDVLRDYNQGKLHGCPDTCGKHQSGNDKPGHEHGKSGHHSKRNWRAV